MAQPPTSSASPANLTSGGTFQQINTSTTIGAPAAAPSQPPSQPALLATATVSQIVSPVKEVNAASLCKHGLEMVQEVIQKTTEIFQWLKQIYLPNGTTPGTITPQMCQEKRVKLEEMIRSVNASFRKLLMIYDKVKEYKDTSRSIEEYLPIEVDGEIQGEKPRITEAVRYASEEHKEVVEQIQLRNRQLKEVIDHLRMMIWEINTMLAVKS